MVSRQERKKLKRQKLLPVCGIFILLLGLALTGWYYQEKAAIPVSTAEKTVENLTGREFLPKWRDVIFAGIPLLKNSVEKPQVVTVVPEITFGMQLQRFVQMITNVDFSDHRSFLKAEIPFLALVKQPKMTIQASGVPNFPKFDAKAAFADGKPLVGIYHTHTSEAFVPSYGKSHSPGGQTGEIVEVGEAMVKRFEKNGIKAIQSKTVHDYPSFMKAYGPSEITAKKMLEENPSLQMLFDIHRDADKRENTTATVNGVAAARVFIVVAKGQTDLVQPHWEQNHAFAKLIDAKLNEHYPGLSRGIQVVDWRYNQHLHPRALLLEIGGHENSKAEAIVTVELLADILTEIMAENRN